jgi:hypothetical protein
MKNAILLGQIRHLLTAVGGALVAFGVLEEGIVTEGIGAAMTIIGFALSVKSKL